VPKIGCKRAARSREDHRETVLLTISSESVGGGRVADQRQRKALRDQMPWVANERMPPAVFCPRVQATIRPDRAVFGMPAGVDGARGDEDEAQLGRVRAPGAVRPRAWVFLTPNLFTRAASLRGVYFFEPLLLTWRTLPLVGERLSAR
jgi:hypothetical protein